MTRYPCSGCGNYTCDGRCYLECPADYADDEPAEDDTGITLAELRLQYGEPLQLTECCGDPFLNRRAA